MKHIVDTVRKDALILRFGAMLLDRRGGGGSKKNLDRPKNEAAWPPCNKGW